MEGCERVSSRRGWRSGGGKEFAAAQRGRAHQAHEDDRNLPEGQQVGLVRELWLCSLWLEWRIGCSCRVGVE